MKILATYNIKGGVGKTASAVNLAHVAAGRGDRVLLWDLDPQGAATFYFRVKPKVKGGGEALLSGRRDLAEVIKGSDYDNLDVVPADFSYRHLDLMLDDAKKPLARLRKVLASVRDEYDYVFLDCAPSISLTSESVFRAADALLVPVIPTTLSIRTFDQLDSFVEQNPEIVRKLKILGFFSMADTRKRLHRELAEELRQQRPELLATQIPMDTDIERMGVHRQPVTAMFPRSRPARAYQSLWDEILERL
ncbi:MAG: ParA family protein [Actinobacteria bacterium]|nr:ParA family protein [Actinomycetota bacterium]